MKIKPIYLIGLFLLLLFYLFYQEAKADVHVEIGPTWLSGEFADGGTLLLSERFGRYDVGIGYVSEQSVTTACGPGLPRSVRCDFDVRENIFVQAQRIVKYKRCEMGIGPAVFQNRSRVFGKTFNFGLMVGCHVTDRFSVRLRHWSNAGSASPNLGQDLLTVGWSF